MPADNRRVEVDNLVFNDEQRSPGLHIHFANEGVGWVVYLDLVRCAEKALHFSVLI